MTLGKVIEEGDIPENLKAQAEEYRDKMIEAAAEQDDELMMKYLEVKVLYQKKKLKKD